MPGGNGHWTGARSVLNLAVVAVTAFSLVTAVSWSEGAAAAAVPSPMSPTWTAVTAAHIGRSAPVVANLGPAGRTVPAVVVGDQAGHLHAYSLASGSAVPGWADINTGAKSIDSALSSDGSRVFVSMTTTRGRATLAAYAPTGARMWAIGACGVAQCDSYSGMALNGTASALFTGGLAYVRGIPTSGSGGWQYNNSDSTNSTPAVVTLTGAGGGRAAGAAVITTNDQTPNAKVGAISGGHLRITSPYGQPLCDANIGGGPAHPGSFDSSPAVASFGAAPVIVFGSGASGTRPNQLMGYNSACQQIWLSPKLGGPTVGSPAIADVFGTGTPMVIEEAAIAQPGNDHVAAVYELNGLTGAILRSAYVSGLDGGRCHNFAQGTASSAVTADVDRDGTQELIVPAGNCGVVILDGRTLAPKQQLGAYCAVQNTPLVTTDPSGALGITMAGYRGKVGGGSEGCIYHSTFAHGVLAPRGWPQFHHDSALSGTLTATFPAYDTLRAGQNLASGKSLVSADGSYRVMMASNGVLTVFRRGGTAVHWAKPSVGGAWISIGTSTFAAVAPGGKLVWQTASLRNIGALTMVMAPNGRLNVLSHDGNEWANDVIHWTTT